MHGFTIIDKSLGRPRWFWPVVTVAIIVLLCASWVLTSVDEFEYMQSIQDDLAEVTKWLTISDLSLSSAYLLAVFGLFAVWLISV